MTSHTYQVSPRCVLRPGDKFRATGGPYYKTADGRKLPMADRGPFTFLAYVEERGRKYIEAHCPDGHTTLYVGPRRRSRVSESLVLRPFKIRGKVGTRGTKRERARGGAA